jgi:hypothetical protein
MPNAPVHIGGLTMRMCRALQYLGSKTEEQRRRERMEKQAVAEAKLRHLRVRAGCGLCNSCKRLLSTKQVRISDPVASAHACSLLSSCARLATMDPCLLEHQQQPEQQSTATNTIVCLVVTTTSCSTSACLAVLASNRHFVKAHCTRSRDTSPSPSFLAHVSHTLCLLRMTKYKLLSGTLQPYTTLAEPCRCVHHRRSTQWEARSAYSSSSPAPQHPLLTNWCCHVSPQCSRCSRSCHQNPAGWMMLWVAETAAAMRTLVADLYHTVVQHTQHIQQDGWGRLGCSMVL